MCLHLTLKRDLLNIVWISSVKEFKILAPIRTNLWKNQSISTVSRVTVVGFIHSFKNLKVLWSLSINAVKYKVCCLIFYSVFNGPPPMTLLKSLATKYVLFDSLKRIYSFYFARPEGESVRILVDSGNKNCRPSLFSTESLLCRWFSGRTDLGKFSFSKGL